MKLDDLEATIALALGRATAEELRTGFGKPGVVMSILAVAVAHTIKQMQTTDGTPADLQETSEQFAQLVRDLGAGELP